MAYVFRGKRLQGTIFGELWTVHRLLIYTCMYTWLGIQDQVGQGDSRHSHMIVIVKAKFGKAEHCWHAIITLKTVPYLETSKIAFLNITQTLIWWVPKYGEASESPTPQEGVSEEHCQVKALCSLWGNLNGISLRSFFLWSLQGKSLFYKLWLVMLV